ncbi:DoxX family membrane protein [Pseudonocardia abyssalis]|uniref:DoxX family membrane protein n=1 Tax=Pseudonocardia abyssalis TaxID=2792008 RepID=A0ABS6UYM5_9PSEU|nr:DoxX family membrane protein [Pseudonocardia abyssalis]MBW0116166.1 DoxX family membrane protein [Pseudonocardia abyssalis]MBW0137267.1 DoxX family membrane protein [Pseudonocardia abyssalis]
MTGQPATIPASYRSLAQAVAILRIFFGVIWLSNGIAKLVDVGSYDLGFATFGLLWLPQAEYIADDASGTTFLGPVGAFYQSVVLPNFGFFGTFLTIVEIAAGLALLFGVVTRAAALGTLLLIGPIWVMYLASAATQYLWTYPVDLLPLLLLAIFPAGRMWGLDGRLAARFGDRWPF